MQTMLITGVTSGIGKALFEHFIMTHHVIGIYKDECKMVELTRSIHEKNLPISYELIHADFLDLSTVYQAVDAITSKYKHLDVIINNAALVGKSFPSKDGLDGQFQVNHLAGIVLVEGLKPLLNSDSIVIYTSSEMHQNTKYAFPFSTFPVQVCMLKTYQLTKLYNLLSAYYYNATHHPFLSLCVHPGLVKTAIGKKHSSKAYSFLWQVWTFRAKAPEKTVFGYACLVNKACIEKGKMYYHQGLAIPYSKHVNLLNAEALMKETWALLLKKEE